MNAICNNKIYIGQKAFYYIFVLKYHISRLFVEKLPKHPDYKSAPKHDKDVNKKVG